MNDEKLMKDEVSTVASDEIRNEDFFIFNERMSLNDMQRVVTKGKRVGRGMGSGLGKTCGRGVSGAKSRSGYSVDPRAHGRFHKTTPKMVFMKSSNPRTYEVSVAVLASKCESLPQGPNFILNVVDKLNIPFYFRRLKVVGPLSQLPFKFPRSVRLKKGFVA